MSSFPQRLQDTLAQVKHFSYLTTGDKASTFSVDKALTLSVDKTLTIAHKIVKEVRKALRCFHLTVSLIFFF